MSRPRPRLRARSPLHGLDRRNLSGVDVFAQSVSGVAPAAAMAATPVLVAASAGSLTVVSFAVATLLVLLIAASIAHFTRRMAAAGGLYSLTAKGLGPVGGFACAVALLVGYALLVAAALTGAAVYLGSLLGRIGVPPPPVGSALLVIALGIAVAALAVRGVRLSSRVVLLVESVSIGLMLAVFGALLASGPVAQGPAPVPAPPPVGFTGVAAGVLPAIAAFIGFEAATALGVEARRPFRTVPRALLWTAGVSGVLFVSAAWVQVLGFSEAGGLAGRDAPVLTLAGLHGWPWVPLVLDLGIATSFFACALVATNALARVLFSLARDGVAPRRLGATSRRWRTPHVAIVAGLPLVIGLPAAVLGTGWSATAAISGPLALATGGFLLAYLLVCLAAPVFLHRIGELTWPAVATSAVITPVLLVVLVAALAGGGAWLAAGLGAAAVLGLGWALGLRRRVPERFAGIGAYDETVAADVLPSGREAA